MQSKLIEQANLWREQAEGLCAPSGEATLIVAISASEAVSALYGDEQSIELALYATLKQGRHRAMRHRLTRALSALMLQELNAPKPPYVC